MVDRQHRSNLVHGVAITGLADICQALSGWQLVADELLDVQGELMHALWTAAHAHELDVAKVLFNLVHVLAQAYVVQEVLVQLIEMLVQIGNNGCLFGTLN